MADELDAKLLEAIDKLKAAADLIETYGTDAIATAQNLVLAVAELLEPRA